MVDLQILEGKVSVRGVAWLQKFEITQRKNKVYVCQNNKDVSMTKIFNHNIYEILFSSKVINIQFMKYSKHTTGILSVLF